MSVLAPIVSAFVMRQLGLLQHRRPLVVGINGAQGIGKTTLVNALALSLREQNLSTVFLSIDDLYLPFEDQNRLALAYPDNPLLKFRGNAGTHSVDLGVATLQEIFNAQIKFEENKEAGIPNPTDGVRVKLPRYDKTANQGRGDRISEDKWPIAVPPFDVVLFEGWMLGFQPEKDLTSVSNPHLVQINQFLRDYSPLDKTFDCFVHLEADDLSNIYAWRLQAEQKTREALGPSSAMTDEQVRDFVDRFMPAYHQYLPAMRASPLISGHQLRVVVNKDRKVVKTEEL